MSLADAVKESLSVIQQPASLQKASVQERIVQYLTLIAKWNKRYNLTAIKTVDDMLYQHILDSLVVIEYLSGKCIIDVGAGAGLPGIPIAIAQADWDVILIESNQKKAAFLQQVKIELELENITVISQRVEKLKIDQSIDTIISRAFASLGHFIKMTEHLAERSDGHCCWVAMKSQCTQQELDEVTSPYYIENKIPLNVPGLAAKRELVFIRKTPNEKPES